MRVGPALFMLLLVAALVGGSRASAASSCPTQTYLRFDHLAYAAMSIPSTVALAPGSRVGSGIIDEPASSNGCKRAEKPVQVVTAGSTDQRVAVLTRGRPRTIFVIGHRCSGFAGQSYWACLLRPLVFHGQQFTGTSYPKEPAPRKTVPLGAAIGKGRYQGQTVMVRRIQRVDPSVAVGISGQPSAAFLSPRTCPYSGFSNTPEFDDLLRCLRSPVWFTFDPPGTQAGDTVIAHSDRPLRSAVAGATLSLVRLSVVADLVPAHHGALVAVGHVGEQMSLRMPDVASGLYEAVVSCPRCTPRDRGTTLYPAGSILLTGKHKTSLAIKIISYALTAALIAAAILSFRTWRRRRRLREAASTGSGAGGS